MDKKGYTLVFVVLAMAALFSLGAALLGIALTDIRIGRHVLDYDRLYYWAEAGVELAIASLPKNPAEFRTFSAAYENTERPPFFRAVVAPAGEGGLLRIRSQGFGWGKTRTVEVLAGLCLLGEKALLSAETAVLDSVNIRGGLLCGSAEFWGGTSRISGKLEYSEGLGTHAGGSYVVGTRLCRVGEAVVPGFDFSDLEERARAEGWFIPEDEVAWYQWHELDTEGFEKVFVPGGLTIGEGFAFSGLIVVRGRVEYRCPESNGVFMVVAEDDIILAMAGPVQAISGSCVLYSKGGILDCRPVISPRLSVQGAMIAQRGLVLTGVDVAFSEQALQNWQAEFPEHSFLPVSSFILEWVDLAQRR